MDPISQVLLFFGLIYGVTATIRRAWHPERRPEPRPRPLPPPASPRRLAVIRVILVLMGLLVLGWYYMLLAA